jgi:hypothetical protein
MAFGVGSAFGLLLSILAGRRKVFAVGLIVSGRPVVVRSLRRSRAMGDYSRQSHICAVVDAAPSTPRARHVLEVVCRYSSFDGPESQVSVPAICRASGLSRASVQRGLADLRNAGVLVPVGSASGGRRVVRYRLVVVGRRSVAVRDELIRSCEAAGRVGAALWLAKVSAELRDGCLYISGDSLPVGQLRDQHLAAIEGAAVRVGASAVEFYVANGGRLRSTG